MFKEDCFYFGFVYKAHGIKGELVIKTKYSISKHEAQEMESIFLDVNGILTPFFIEKIISYNNNHLLLKIEDINDDISAKKWVSTEVFIEEKTLQLFKNNEQEIDYTGFHVYDENASYIGEVLSVKSFPGQEMLELSYNSESILIPITDQWLLDVSLSEKRMTLDLPEGLLDIND